MPKNEVYGWSQRASENSSCYGANCQWMPCQCCKLLQLMNGAALPQLQLFICQKLWISSFSQKVERPYLRTWSLRNFYHLTRRYLGWRRVLIVTLFGGFSKIAINQFNEWMRKMHFTHEQWNVEEYRHQPPQSTHLIATVHVGRGPYYFFLLSVDALRRLIWLLVLHSPLGTLSTYSTARHPKHTYLRLLVRN